MPNCPVTDTEREWIESGMAWLAKEFGWDRLRLARVILPTPEFFPDDFAGTPEDVRVMLDRVCGYMGIPPHTVDLEIYSERSPISEGRSTPGTAGLYDMHEGRHRVWLEERTIAEPVGLVATIAHELGHVLLLGQGRISTDRADHEQLTDLLTDFLGLGVFSANAVIREHNWRDGNWSGWSVGRSGYLSMMMHAYALALFAHVRGEWKPAWSKHLRLDVRTAFEQSARYLAETRPPEFRPKHFAGFDKPNPVEPEIDDVMPPEETDEGQARCTYCGVIIPAELVEFTVPLAEDDVSGGNGEVPSSPGQRLGICVNCRESIDERDAERAEEARDQENDARLAARNLKIGCVSFLVLFLIIFPYFLYLMSK